MKKQEQDIRVFDFNIPPTENQERQVLADMLAAPELLGDMIPMLNEEHFTSSARKKIYGAIIDLYNKGEQVDLVSLSMVIPDQLKEILPSYENAGMATSLLHAKQLRDAAAKRRCYYAVAGILTTANTPGTTEEDLLAATESFNRAIEGAAPLQGEKQLSEVLHDVRVEVQKTQKAIEKGIVPRITTGFQYMDKILNGGFKSGQLVILAARPSVGKTAVMLQLAKSAAKAGNPVQVFSLEMQANELGERLLYSTGEVRPYQVNFGKIDWQVYDKAENELYPLPLYINDFSRSLDEIVARLTQAVKKGRCKIAFIDYLGLMSDALNFGNAKLYQVIARITGTMKAVAKRLEIPIVLLCQLNRDAARDDRAPELYDLRDSGSIEQDADIVLMLQSQMQDKGRLLVWLRKHRGGKKEIVFPMIPNDTYSHFEEGLPENPDGTPEDEKAVLASGKWQPVKFFNESAEKDEEKEDNYTTQDDLPF